MRTVGFGLERVGLLAHRFPKTALTAIALAIAVAGYGLTQISVDRDLREMFRGESEAYRTYLRVAADFFDPENQVLVLVGSDAAIDAVRQTALLDLHLELQLLPEAKSVYSLFSLRTPPAADGHTEPLVDPQADLDGAAVAAIRSHPIAGGSLVSDDGRLVLFAVEHAQRTASPQQLSALIDAIKALLPEVLEDTGLTATVTGIAAIRSEIVGLLERDQIVLNGAGIAIGWLLSIFFFRSWVAALMTALPATIAGLCLVGFTAALHLPVTVISGVVPVLVMVLGYADGMHLTSSWRRYRERGCSAAGAELRALLESAPPCMLTALAMSIAFLSMTTSDVALIRDFAWTGAVGTMVGTWIVLASHALAGRWLGRFWSRHDRTSKPPLDRLNEPLAILTGLVVRFRWPIAVGSVPLTAVCGVLFLLVSPEHSVRETLPSSTPSVAALMQIDDRLGGSFPVEIVVPLAGSDNLGQAVRDVAAVHEAVATIPGVRSTLSLWSLAQWMGYADEQDIGRLEGLIAALPADALGRFLGSSGALVTVNIPGLSTKDTLVLLDRIESAALAAAPGAIVTGATVLAAREGAVTIGTLNASLGLAVFGGILLIAIALRSVLLGIVALIPNVLPDMATGSVLYFLGDGMQLTTLVGLIIAFGIAIDDTTHYLNAVRRLGHIADLRQRVLTASRRIGPVLVGTTLVVVAGASATLTSGLSSMVLFGIILLSSLLLAMAGDLLVLPAIITGPAARWFRSGRRAWYGQ